jgi:hypothetical protein
MVATMLVAIFFASIFELNAVCLRYMDASKESLAALQSVQDRSEALRNLAFSDLTTTAFVRDNVMPANYTPPDPGGVKPATSFSKKATEVVKISKCTIPLRSHRLADIPSSRACRTALLRRILRRPIWRQRRW